MNWLKINTQLCKKAFRHSDKGKSEILYGFAKIHKALADGIPYFCPSLSAIGAHTYKLAKFCGQWLKTLTELKF